MEMPAEAFYANSPECMRQTIRARRDVIEKFAFREPFAVVESDPGAGGLATAN